MTLTEIKRILNKRGGLTTLRVMRQARSIGSGAQRTAYRVGKYVVKANTCAFELSEFPEAVRVRMTRVPSKVIRSVGLLPPKVWYAGKRREYVIMPFYPHHPDYDWWHEECADVVQNERPFWEIAPGVSVGLDLHAHNVGRHPKSGRLVAFDW